MKGAFASMNLCGPRVMALPGKETTSLCELFYSYPHLMKSFQEQFKAMLPAAAGRRRRLLAHERGMSTNSKIGNHSSYAAIVLNAILQKVDKVEKEDQALRKENSEIRGALKAVTSQFVYKRGVLTSRNFEIAKKL
jgi:hypothetical protein